MCESKPALVFSSFHSAQHKYRRWLWSCTCVACLVWYNAPDQRVIHLPYSISSCQSCCHTPFFIASNNSLKANSSEDVTIAHTSVWQELPKMTNNYFWMCTLSFNFGPCATCQHEAGGIYELYYSPPSGSDWDVLSSLLERAVVSSCQSNIPNLSHLCSQHLTSSTIIEPVLWSLTMAFWCCGSDLFHAKSCQ